MSEEQSHGSTEPRRQEILDPSNDTPLLQATGGDTGSGLRKGGWIVAARLVSQSAQFLTMLVAARVMGPAEFGGFALLSAGAIGLTRFSEAGWREYVMTVDDPAAAAQANVLALICGIVSFIIGLVASLVLLMLDEDASIAGMVILMALWVLLATLTATQSGILVKRNQLRALALTQIVGEIAGFLAAVLTFRLYGGIFGLVASKLGMQITVLALSLSVTRWFPRARVRRETAREAYVFSRRILATRLIGFAQDNVSIFVIGALIGPAGAGLFRAAGRLGGALFEVVSEPVRLLAWSTLRPEKPGPAADRLLRLMLIVATPLFVGLAVTADDVVYLLLGPNWAACAPLLVLFALAGWLNTLNIVTEPLLVMSGRIDLVPRLSLAVTVLHLAFLLALAPFGILWIAVGQAVAALCTLPLILRIQQRSGGISLRKLVHHSSPALVGAVLLILAVWAVGMALSEDMHLAVRMAVKIGAGALAYFIVIAALVPRHVWKLQEAFSLAK
jgi:O-antigen/teichoic acid export membrane protein